MLFTFMSQQLNAFFSLEILFYFKNDFQNSFILKVLKRL